MYSIEDIYYMIVCDGIETTVHMVDPAEISNRSLRAAFKKIQDGFDKVNELMDDYELKVEITGNDPVSPETFDEDEGEY